MTLAKYKEKRNFKVTPEPSGDELAKKAADKHLLYVIQKHRATQLHYDFRLEFEGVIPEGEYGGGTVMVWDTGTWTPESQSADVAAALKKGDLKFLLHGKKLHGSWVLVRTHGFGSSSGKSWLLIKHRDEFASTEDIVATEPKSAVSKRLLVDIARDGGGDVEKAATGDPQPKTKVEPQKSASKKPSAKSSAARAKTTRRAKQ